MSKETFKFFKYEIALGSALPIPGAPLDFHTSYQNSLQQFLHRLCKVKIGSLGKREGQWDFAGEEGRAARLYTRKDVTELLDYAEQLGIIVEASPDEVTIEEPDPELKPYKLSPSYWDKFEKFAG